ncbi:MAG: nucleotidyl transferase AbiEii/AbiGii toxin family protein [Leptospirillum sp.]
MAENWETLFDKAMFCLDSRHDQAPPWMRWSLGGGTALMLQVGHRVSKDIDIFVNDVQSLTLYTPRLNEAIEDLTTDFEEEVNYVKLRFGEEGEIDFIAVASLTDNPWTEQVLRGRNVRLETPEEIVVKKLMFRPATLAYRDVFDVAAVASSCPGLLEHSCVVFGDKLAVLRARVEFIDGLDLTEERASIDVLPGFEHLLGTETGVVLSFLDRCEASLDGPSEAPKHRPRL